MTADISSAKESIFVHIIADYGTIGDMAFAEVRHSMRYHLRDFYLDMDSSFVPAFDTVATGMMLGQLAINQHIGRNCFFYVNTAPRKDDLTARGNNAGEGLAYARLKNGVQIVAVNSGYSLSFIKPFAETIRLVNCSNEGSQFRSRDIFPVAFAALVQGDMTQLGADIMEHVPDMPQNVLCYTDGYGNLKTSLSETLVQEMHGKDVTLTINGVSHQVAVGKGIFSVPDGKMVLSIGSSGWDHEDGTRTRFVECVLRGGSAAAAFNYPKGGAVITWQ